MRYYWVKVSEEELGTRFAFEDLLDFCEIDYEEIVDETMIAMMEAS